jgi:putative ABC transport system substrate-binding protein
MRLPAIYEWREFPAAGGLMSYGPSLAGMFELCGVYAARLLGGVQPRELPVQQPTSFALVINAATARSLGLSIPPTVLARADAVIE